MGQSCSDSVTVRPEPLRRNSNPRYPMQAQPQPRAAPVAVHRTVSRSIVKRYRSPDRFRHVQVVTPTEASAYSTVGRPQQQLGPPQPAIRFTRSATPPGRRATPPNTPSSLQRLPVNVVSRRGRPPRGPPTLSVAHPAMKDELPERNAIESEERRMFRMIIEFCEEGAQRICLQAACRGTSTSPAPPFLAGLGSLSRADRTPQRFFTSTNGTEGSSQLSRAQRDLAEARAKVFFEKSRQIMEQEIAFRAAIEHDEAMRRSALCIASSKTEELAVYDRISRQQQWMEHTKSTFKATPTRPPPPPPPSHQSTAAYLLASAGASPRGMGWNAQSSLRDPFAYSSPFSSHSSLRTESKQATQSRLARLSQCS